MLYINWLLPIQMAIKGMDKRKILVLKIIWSVTCLQTYKFSSMSTFLSVFHDMKKAHLPFLFWYMRVVVILLFCFVHGGMCRGQIFFFFFGFDQPFFITQYILHAGKISWYTMSAWKYLLDHHYIEDLRNKYYSKWKYVILIRSHGVLVPW